MKIKSIKVKTKEENKKDIFITTPFITLDSALKLSGIANTGGQAKLLIANGEISVNGEICLMRGKKLYLGDTFSFLKESYEVKSK